MKKIIIYSLAFFIIGTLLVIVGKYGNVWASAFSEEQSDLMLTSFIAAMFVGGICIAIAIILFILAISRKDS
jgi:choline-glycine betaine transporter